MYKGVQRIFVGVAKYFRHILTGHEKFYKIFDGSQNVFSCSIFVISFFSLRGLEHKIPKLAMKEIQEKQDMLNKSHLLSRYKANNGKNKNKMFDAF